MDDFECEFDKLDKLITQEINSQADYDDELKPSDSASVLEAAYSKVSFFSDSTWWNPDEVDEYRMNNLGLWSALIGSGQTSNHKTQRTPKNASTINEGTSKIKKVECKKTEVVEEPENPLKNSPWPASLLSIYPQLPDAVASKNDSVLCRIHSTFAGDLLHLRIGNVKELIQYNRLKQDCVKNLWKELCPYEGFTKNNPENFQESKICKPSNDEVPCSDETETLSEISSAKKEICDSYRAIISRKSTGKNQYDKSVKIKLFERKKVCQKCLEKSDNVHNNQIDEYGMHENHNKKIKTEKHESAYSRNTQSKNKTSQSDTSKKNVKSTERNNSLIKENFGTFPINYQGEIIETLEEVCQWLENVYPQKTNETVVTAVETQRERLPSDPHPTSLELVHVEKKNNTQIKKIVSRPTVTELSVFSHIPPRRLYRDVLASSEVHSCMDTDPIHKFAELEREALEQYSGCNIHSETSVPLLQIDEESKFKDLEREAIEQYQPEEDSVNTSGELFTTSEILKQSPIGTPPRVHSVNLMNIYDAPLDKKREANNTQECESENKSTTKNNLLGHESWITNFSGINIFSDCHETKFEDTSFLECFFFRSQIEQCSKSIMSVKAIENKFDEPIRILKPPSHKDCSVIDSSSDFLNTSKNSVHTSLCESPNEELQMEENGSKIAEYVLRKEEQETAKNEIQPSQNKKKKSKRKSSPGGGPQNKPRASTSKPRDSDEDKSGQEESKKKKKKKKRSRKKKGCKKDGGGGGGGSNGKGGGVGRCDARTPLHCALPIVVKNLESRIKRKDEMTKKEKKQGESSFCGPLRSNWLYNKSTTKLSKNENFKKNLFDDLFYDEQYIESMNMNDINHSSVSNHFLKRISPFLFVFEIGSQKSILLDSSLYRLRSLGWNYLNEKDLFNKGILLSRYYKKIERLFPPWLKWCKCFNLRIGHCHSIYSGLIISPYIWRIPNEEIFNTKYWEMAALGKSQGLLVNITSLIKVVSSIFSLIKNCNQLEELFSGFISDNLINDQTNNNNQAMLEENRIAYESVYQKIYHVCSFQNRFKIYNNSESSSSLSKKTRHKRHRGRILK